MKNNKYKKVVETLINDLEEGLLFCDIWSKETGLSVDGYNQNAQYSALFGRVSKNIDKTLKELGLPGFGKYQVIDLEADTMLFILNLDNNYLLGGLVDKNLVNIGVLLNIAFPNAQDAYNS